MFRYVTKEQLRVPAKIDYLGALRDFVSKIGHKHGFSERVINAFKLSIDEAATNIIKHAYRDWDGDITIRAIIKKNSLTIILLDQGKFFDPRQVSDPDLKRYVDIGKKGGLGIFIMRRLLNSIDYRKTEEGNELRLVKYRDVARKRKISVPSIPMSLKARYWLVANGIFTAVVAALYLFSSSQEDDRILNRNISRGQLACSILATQTARTLSDIPEDILPREELKAMATKGGKNPEILQTIQGPISTISMSEHKDIIYKAYLVDVNGMIIAPSNSPLFLDNFDRPANTKQYQKGVHIFTPLNSDTTVIDIVYQVLSMADKVQLCEAHIFLNKNEIDKEIANLRRKNTGPYLFIWLVGSVGLVLLIYIVMNPFRRLAEWVKILSQPGVQDEMDIDSSTEVGEIAKAFSDITNKLRESQVNMAEQERMQKEMQVAKEIQQTLLPSEFPEVEGYELSSYYEAAKEVGGDYFDFVEVDKDTLGIVVADVSGKGVPGSLVMTMIRTALRTEARGVKSAAEVLARVNDFVVNDMKKGMFVTLFYVIIDSKRRRINYASAGHNPMILYRVGTKQTYYLNPRGFPIGISLPDKDLFRKSIESDTIQLAEDDILIVYTDGITEAMNSQRHLFGEERLLKVIREFGHQHVEPFVQSLTDEIHYFTEGNIQNDDITFVAIKEKTSAEKIELGRAKRAHQLILSGTSIREACDKAGISTYAYYNKYKEVFDKEGVDSYELDDTIQIEAKHLSIEEKTKIYDIIRVHPEYGAKRISEELYTEKYGSTRISVSKIYEELVRSRLNTRELRQAFVKSGGRKRGRFKPPGTPLLTLDGKIIMQRGGLDPKLHPEPEEFDQPAIDKSVKKKSVVDHQDLQGKEEQELPAEPVKMEEPAKDESVRIEEEISTEIEETEKELEFSPDSTSLAEIDEDLLLTTPIEELLQKDESKESPAESGLVTVEDDYETDLQGFDSFDYAKSDDEPDEDEMSEVSDLEIKVDSRLFDKIDSEELDVARLIESNGGFESPATDEYRLEGGFTEPSTEDIVQEYADIDFSEPSVEEGEIIEEEDITAQIEPNGYDLVSGLTEPFDEFLEIEEEKGLVSSEGEVDVSLSDQFVDELDSFLEETEISEGDKGFKWDIKETDLLKDSRLIGADEEDEHKLSFTELMDFIDEKSFSMSDNGDDPDASEGVKSESIPNEIVDISYESNEAPDFTEPFKDSDNLLTQDKELFLKQKRVNQALKLYESEDYVGAVKEANALVDIDPDFHAAYTIVGNSCFRLENFKQAAEAYEKVKELDPKNVTARENLGVIYANKGDLKAAIREWEKVLVLAPNRKDISESIARAKRFLGLK